MSGLDFRAAAALVETPAAARVLDALDRDGEETRIVGGAVRNALIGRPVTDIDLATTAPPRETIARARRAGLKAVPTGIDHGTVTVVASGVPFEVTTLRQDIETDGRHAVVRFGRDFAADAMRRDFTINALSIGRDGKVEDHTGGRADLEARRVRFIGEARQRIREDYLRILRFFRFSAEYVEGELDPVGLDAAIREREGLDRLSRERLRAELMKLVAARRAADTVAALSGCGLLARLAGGVGEIGRLRRSEGAEPVVRLAALLVATVEDADRLRARLRLSNAEHGRLVSFAQVLARLRSGPDPLGRADIRRLAATFGSAALAVAARIVAGEPRPALDAAAACQLDRFTTGEEPAPRFATTGADLIGQGIPPGPEVGRRLAAARAEWLAGGCP